MKFLHLGDLHLGKVVHQYSMLADQRQLLQQVCACADDRQADAVIIAGDVYDRHTPPEEAVILLDDFLTALIERGLQVFVIAGNHDSRMRLRFGSRLMEAQGLHIACDPQDALRPITLHDEWGALHVWLLPFIKPVYVRSFLQQEVNGWQEAVSRMIDANIEGYRAIRDAGHEILPKADAEFEGAAYLCARASGFVAGPDAHFVWRA